MLSVLPKSYLSLHYCFAGPLMLAMGIHPKVGCATSACMILFTSFTATTSFIVFGLLLPDYATVCLVVGFSATCVGQMSLSYLMKKLQRNSFIAFSIGIVVLLSGNIDDYSILGWHERDKATPLWWDLRSIRPGQWNGMKRKLCIIDL